MNRAIIIDNGSLLTKCGFAGEGQPSSVFPTIVNYLEENTTKSLEGGVSRDYYVGKEAIKHIGSLESLRYPLKRGIIPDWDVMEKIWHYTFENALKVDPAQHPVLLTEKVLNYRDAREKTAEILFETFNIPALCLVTSGELALYSSGRETGCVIDIGGDTTQVIIIWNNLIVPYASINGSLGAERIDYNLASSIRNSSNLDYDHYKNRYFNFIRDLKEKYCYVEMDPRKIRKISNSELNNIRISHKLSNGEEVNLDWARFIPPEVLFNTGLTGGTTDQLDELIADSIAIFDRKYSQDLFNNILLIGGTAMLPGLKERLAFELKKFIPKSFDINIFIPPEPLIYSWLGGSKIASHEKFNEILVTKEDYKEYGSQVIHRDISGFHNVIKGDASFKEEVKKNQIKTLPKGKFVIDKLAEEEKDKQETRAKDILSDLDKDFGCVAIIGKTNIYAIPICKGLDLKPAISKTNFGSQYLVNKLSKRLRNLFYEDISGIDEDDLRKIILEQFNVSSNPRGNLLRGRKVRSSALISLPNGVNFNLNPWDFLIPELFFNPPDSVFRYGGLGLTFKPIIERERLYLDSLITYAISRVDVELRKDLYQNIILTGDFSTMRGLKERLTEEIKKMTPHGIEIKVIF